METIAVKVQHHDQQLELPLVVVAGSGPSLLGQDWLAKIQLNWQSMFATSVEETPAYLIQWHDGFSRTV